MSIAALRAEIEANEPRLIARLRELVERESPSEDKTAVDFAGELVAQWAAQMGARVERHAQEKYGDVLELQFGTRLPVKGQALVLAHLDTVWPMGTLERMPWREADGKLFGPGVLDIKAGIVMTLEAIAAVQKLGGLNRRVTLLLVSEEEIGSPVSRPITERLAGRSAEVFVVEPAQGLAYKTARKGVGHYELHVAGVAAHSGVDFERGHSAIREMARLVEEVSGFTDLSKGRTLNVGVIQGGTRSNVVAAECRAEVDVRVVRARDVAAVERMFKKLKVADRKCRLSVSGGINRPPMERKPGTVKLFQQAREFAAELGVVLEEAATGGGSDGNFTAALGVPTLDGMGAVGAGAHADHEHVVKKHLVERAALLAAMMAGPDQSRSRRTVAATGRPTTLK